MARNPLLDAEGYHGDPLKGVTATNADLAEVGEAQTVDVDSLESYAVGGGYYEIDGVKIRGKAKAQAALDEALAGPSADNDDD